MSEDTAHPGRSTRPVLADDPSVTDEGSVSDFMPESTFDTQDCTIKGSDGAWYEVAPSVLMRYLEISFGYALAGSGLHAMLRQQVRVATARAEKAEATLEAGRELELLEDLPVADLRRFAANAKELLDEESIVEPPNSPKVVPFAPRIAGSAQRVRAVRGRRPARDSPRSNASVRDGPGEPDGIA